MSTDILDIWIGCKLTTMDNLDRTLQENLLRGSLIISDQNNREHPRSAPDLFAKYGGTLLRFDPSRSPLPTFSQFRVCGYEIAPAYGTLSDEDTRCKEILFDKCNVRRYIATIDGFDKPQHLHIIEPDGSYVLTYNVTMPPYMIYSFDQVLSSVQSYQLGG